MHAVNTTQGEQQAYLTALLKDEGKTIAVKTFSARLSRNKNSIMDLELPDLEGISLWDVEAPKLYTLEVILKCGEYEDSYSESVGFRECRTRCPRSFFAV